MKNTDEGFTLVEVVVSIALFILVSGAATFAVVSSIRASNATDQRVAVGNVAQQEMERVRALGPDPVSTNRPPATRSITASDGRKYTVKVTATPTWTTSCFIGTGTGYRDLTVEVASPGSRISSVFVDSRIACATRVTTP